MDKKTQPTRLTAKNLKAVLWDTLQDVKSGKMEPGQADAIAVQAREILRTTQVQLSVAKISTRQVSSDVIDFAENRIQK